MKQMEFYYMVQCSRKNKFIKAIGIAIIIAQAGLYVPADSFIFFHIIHFTNVRT